MDCLFFGCLSPNGNAAVICRSICKGILGTASVVFRTDDGFHGLTPVPVKAPLKRHILGTTGRKMHNAVSESLDIRAFRGIKNDTIDGYIVSIYGI